MDRDDKSTAVSDQWATAEANRSITRTRENLEWELVPVSEVSRDAPAMPPIVIPLRPEVADATALVVDGNNASRSVLVRLLRDFSVAEVMQARRAWGARRMLEQQHFDIVVCDDHFDGEPDDTPVRVASGHRCKSRPPSRRTCW